MKINKKELYSLIKFFVDSNPDNLPIIVAIDGRSASGKTTFANLFKDDDGFYVIHTDDFYRPKNSQGELEISEFDGNFDLERFKIEVVDKLNSNSFSYGVFDCRDQAITKTVTVEEPKCIIIEGAYSHNPNLSEYADLKIFFDIGTEQQKERIIKRNGKESFDAFKSLWIQAEERYFCHYSIEETSDYIITEENNGNI